MAIVFMGVYWIVIAILGWFGWARVTKKEYRDKPWRKAYQRDIAVPDAIVGVGLLLWGLRYPDYHAQNSLFFVAGIVVIGVIAFVLVIRVRNKYNLW